MGSFSKKDQIFDSINVKISVCESQRRFPKKITFIVSIIECHSRTKMKSLFHPSKSEPVDSDNYIDEWSNIY
jgi:hypothetical protein